MTDNSEIAPSIIVDNLPPLIKRLRTHDANGSFAAADLLEAAHRILIAPGGRSVHGNPLSNADHLRLLALRMPADWS